MASDVMVSPVFTVADNLPMTVARDEVGYLSG